MTKEQLIVSIVASDNFEWRSYADQYHLSTKRQVSLHLLTQDYEFVSMLYEINCIDEALQWYDRDMRYVEHDMTQDEFNAMMYH